MWIYTTAAVTSHLYDMRLAPSDVAILEQTATAIEAKGVEPGGSLLMTEWFEIL